jgi:hypothetical protein
MMMMIPAKAKATPLIVSFMFASPGSTPTSNANERYELMHGGGGGSKSADSSPKSSSHDESANGTPDPNHLGGGGSSSKHSTLSHRGTPENEGHQGQGGGNGSPGSMAVSSASSGFPSHFSLASYYSQLNQGIHPPGAHGNPLTPSLAHMAQYGHSPIPTSGQNPYASMGHHQGSGSAPAGGPNAGNDFRRALPVIF